MSKESVTKSVFSGKCWLSILVVVILVPATLVGSWIAGSGRYYLSSVLLIIYAMVPFFVSFEKRRPQAREIVTLAVMCAIAVASRAAFIMIPFFKPMTGIIIITAMAFGPETGFLTGAISAFVSNFIFGQGPWTPWQMFAFGMAGFLAGILSKKNIISAEKKVPAAIFGGLVVLFVVGPILDTSTLFGMSSMINPESAAAAYLSGLPVNIVHGVATVLTVFFLAKPIIEKLDRIKLKYGMMGGE